MIKEPKKLFPGCNGAALSFLSTADRVPRKKHVCDFGQGTQVEIEGVA
jgi:hypothetical protein